MINTQVNSLQKWVREGIKDLLEEIDLDEELKLLRDELESATGQRLTRAIKRLEVVESFRNSGNKAFMDDFRCCFNHPQKFVQWFN